LRFDEGTGVISSDIQQWDALVVSIFSARIFSIAHKQHFLVRVKITALNPTNLLLSHRRCYCESNDSSHRCLLARILIEASHKTVEFCLCRATIALIAFPNKPEPTESNTSEINRLNRNSYAMNGSSV
jgi:hypothetical protein